MDKPDITPGLVTCLLASQFPQLADLPVSAVELDGCDNTTFRLGDDMSVRLPSADAYVAQVDKEHRWLPILADHLPLAIPHPLARGVPGCGYPRPWSIYRWLEGQQTTIKRIADLTAFATALAEFLAALYSIDTTGGPPAGRHSFYRGGPLSTYDTETRAAIGELADEIDDEAATQVWEAALSATGSRRPVWVHGDVAPSNLLVVDGRLSAVIDFGCSAVGDPACDTVIAWTFLSGPSREAFRAHLPVDEATWARGRGWALWKALITYAEAQRRRPLEAHLAGLSFGWRHSARSVIDDLLTEYQRHL
ncbi:MAG: aminoglycoside phosphotransferase family protein [Acidimicrobiia bacterium]